ncbi:MAG TPA: hypothetical protein VGL11_19585 [Candidatus Binatia bacterium]|jgi:hypothetical protein
MRRLFQYALTIVLLAGCTITQQVIPVSYEPATVRPSADRHDYQNAAKAIAYVMVEELKLPRVEAVLIIYPTRAEYESGFVAEVGSTPSQAAGRTHFLAMANCKYKKVLVNGQSLSRLPWSSRVKTLAHELTHIAQYSLGNSRCSSPHSWLSEGFANWAAFKVVESLGLDTFAKERETFVESVYKLKSNRTLPALSQMAVSSDWEYLAKSLGADATYAQSFLAVDFLIEKKSLPAVIEYFSLFARSNNRNVNFMTAFGEDVSVFEQEFGAHLQKLLI